MVSARSKMPRIRVGQTGLVVRVNGTQFDRLLHASITSTNCFSADSFSFALALESDVSNDVLFWASMSSGYVEIEAVDAAGTEAEVLITGMIDSVTLDPLNLTVAVEGRDLSSSMIDRYRQQDFVNQTASEVVAQIAQSHNLTPVMTSTFENVGRYYGDGYTRLSLGQYSRIRSDWDLVVELARENGFDAYVQGRFLFFRATDLGIDNLVQLRRSDIQHMRVERSLVVPSDTAARVQSWDSQQMTAYNSSNIDTGTAPSGVSTTNVPQAFLFSATNLTPSQVSDSAGRFATELGRLAIVLQFEMLWDLRLAPRSRIVLDQWDVFDGLIFSVDSVERRFSSTAGSTQSVRAISR